jgi:cyanophycinase
MAGPIAFVGGNEFNPPARELDEWLLHRAGTKQVTVVPTAAALQNPQRAIDTAAAHFSSIGGTVLPVMVLGREDAMNSDMAQSLATSRFIYLTGGNPRRTVKVLEGAPAWKALLQARRDGAVIAGSSAGAMIMCGTMLVPRWKEPSPGLGVFPQTMVVPHHDAWIRRIPKVTRSEAARGLKLFGIDECTGLILDGRSCRILGAGSVTCYKDGDVVWTEAAPATRKTW